MCDPYFGGRSLQYIIQNSARANRRSLIKVEEKSLASTLHMVLGRVATTFFDILEANL